MVTRVCWRGSSVCRGRRELTSSVPAAMQPGCECAAEGSLRSGMRTIWNGALFIVAYVGKRSAWKLPLTFTPQGVPILSLMPDSGFDYVEEGLISDSSFLLLLLQCRSNYKLPPCPRFSLCSPAMLNSSSPLPSASACFCSAQRKINTLVSVHWWQTSVQKQANWEIAKKRKTIRSLLLPWSWTLSSPPCCLVLPIYYKKKCTGKNS